MFRLPFPISYLDNTNFSHRGHNLEVCKTKLTRHTHTQTHTHIYLGFYFQSRKILFIMLKSKPLIR